MFDFQKLIVYQKSLVFCERANVIIEKVELHNGLRDQLQRASSSILLNIAEGSSRLSNRDRRHFYVIARGSAYECAAILELLLNNKKINISIYGPCISLLTEISKMLYTLINKLIAIKK